MPRACAPSTHDPQNDLLRREPQVASIRFLDQAARTRRSAALLASVAAAGLLCAASAIAQDAVPQAVAERLRAVIANRTQGKVPVDTVEASPVPGIYQIASEGEIFYVDETGRYSFVGGALIDLQSQKDLTAPVLERLQSIDFDSLPLHLAVKEVHGQGRRQMALFEDPNCPVCRVFTKFVDQIDDVTVYRFIYPVIAPQSQALARVAWCSGDKAAVWKGIMAGQRPTGDETCDTSGVADILKLGEKYRILNTPTVILGNGKRLVGATSPEQFIAELDASAR